MHGDRSKTLRLGQFLWPRIARTLVDGPLTSAVPSEANRLPEFDTLAKASAEFERALEAEGLIPELEKGHELSAFAADIDLHFATKKRTSLLARARDLVTRADLCFNTVTVQSAANREPSDAQSPAQVASEPEPKVKKARPLGRKGGVGTLVKEGEVANDSRGEPSSGVPGVSGRQRENGEEADECGPFFHLPTCQVQPLSPLFRVRVLRGILLKDSVVRFSLDQADRRDRWLTKCPANVTVSAYKLQASSIDGPVFDCLP